MKKFLDVIIFLLLIAVIAIANNNFLGLSLGSAESQKATFAPELQVSEIIYTTEFAPKVFGYGGQIPMAIGVDANGTIKDIKVLQNTETPTFLNQVLSTKILDNWIGMNIKNAKTNVDAVSGATMSSQAIIASINMTIDAKNGKVTDTNQDLNTYEIIKTFAVLFAGLLGLFMFFAPKKANKIRPFIQALIVMILGVWQGSMLSVAKISAWLLHGVPDYYQYGLFAIFLISIFVPMITGKNFYCYNLCPFGAAQDLVNQSIKSNIKIKVVKWLVYARFAILMFCLLLLIFGYGSYIAILEPFSAFKPEYANMISIIIFAVSLFLSIFIARPWCKYFCPCGAFLDMFKKQK